MHNIKGIISVAGITLIAGAIGACAARPERSGAPATSSAKTARVSDGLSILGPTEVSADRMWAFVAAVNPDFPHSIATAFHEIGQRYGIRGDVALCQAVIETGWFRFADGTAVTPDQHNYCGLGVTKRGMKGHSFDTMEDGVTAQMQHLYAYASPRPLPAGEKIIDPRFTLVRRGIASSWLDLNRRWAANDRYGESILALFERLLNDNPPTPDELRTDELPVLEVGIPDDYIN